MRARSLYPLALLMIAVVVPGAVAGEAPLAEDWDYVPATAAVTARFHGRPGVVLHVGDSITYANPYGQWARGGKGQQPDDRAALAWMHAGADDDTDGWWLARVDLPGGRSHTACGGLRADELLAGGKGGMPSLDAILDRYRPQVAVLMIGTNDASAGRPLAAYRADAEKAVAAIVDRGIICILSTIPPHPHRRDLAASYNDALRDLGRRRGLPMIDYEREILKRRPDDWNGTLLQKDDVHPTATDGPGAPGPASEPTAENLARSGYLLRGWLSVRKVAEVKHAVLDARPAPGSAAAGALRLPATRDTWFSGSGSEGEANLGGASKLKLKSYQEMSVIDVDPAPIRGRVVKDATLHLRSSGEPRLLRVTVGSLGSDWIEGTSPRYAPQAGSSSFRHRANPDVAWTRDGGDLCRVILGQGGTAWRMADATEPDARGWQRIAVDPAIVAARAAGISHGFLIFDDTGSEWTRDGEKFTMRNFPNRFVHSRESGPESAPYLTVSLGQEDRGAPARPGALRSDVADLPAGEAWVTWNTPADEGPAGTIGFFVAVDGKEVPRDLVPLAGKPGEPVRMHLRDLGLAAGADVSVAVRAVDGAGNRGEVAELRLRVSDRVPRPLPPLASPAKRDEPAPLPRLGDLEVAIVDELDKVQPVTGEMIPRQDDGYLAANHLWDSRSRTIRLHAARNEFTGFQVLLRGSDLGVRPELHFGGAGASGVRAEFGRYRPVSSRKGPLPDPIVPLAWEAAGRLDGQTSASLHCELYVPHDAAAGEHRGRLALTSSAGALELEVVLRVWDFTLPDDLSFLPEMNTYGLPAADEREFYRLAHRHRTVLNRVPYSQRGIVDDGCAPRWDGKRLDWTAWDRRFGPYFDGSAFADLPRKGVPIECFYLPLHENWPSTIDASYRGGYWADRAFPDSYRRAFVDASRQTAEHVDARGWNGTIFQCFLNGKNNYKERGWSRGSSPWLLDEPAHFQDFWALRYFGAAFHEGVRQAHGRGKLAFRADVSRPQWQRDALDGLVDYNVVGGALRPYRRIVMDRKAANGELVVEYGTSNAIEEANVQAVGWSLDSWSLGTDGVLPWQTVGTARSWRQADTLALFYPAPGGGAPLPSIRLKAYRRGQQDVEYLTLYSLLTGEPRWAVGRAVREALGLDGRRRGTGFTAGEDAGVIHFSRLRPQDAWALRSRIGRFLSDAHPAPARRLRELRTPARDPSRLAPGYAAGAGP